MDAQLAAKAEKQLQFAELRDRAKKLAGDANALSQRTHELAKTLFGPVAVEGQTPPQEPKGGGICQNLSDALDTIGTSIRDCGSALDRF